jgi:hypothetical protein
MPELCLSREQTCHGLRAITLENRFLRLVVLPEAGARIWQITYKPNGADLLWNNPHIPPARLPANSSYDDVWSGGWDELFPNDEPATIQGRNFPDHGELWTGGWEDEVFRCDEEVSLKLRFAAPLSSVEVEKTITLRKDDARLRFEHRLTNAGKQAFPFLWKLHPAFAVTPQHRIDFPPMQVVLEPAFPGTLNANRGSFPWPYAPVNGSNVDLRRVPAPEERQLYFFYGTQIEAGWCALTNTATGLACGLRFDAAIFPTCWLFASYGGWHDYNVAVLEPCTGYPLHFETMQAAGRERNLGRGETLHTEVLFSVQEGMKSVGEINADGKMAPAL